MIDVGDEMLPLGCLGPRALLFFGKIALFAVFFYALGELLGFWGA